MIEGGPASVIALGDQVQAACENSNVDVIGFVLMVKGGTAEYRSRLNIEDMRTVLTQVAKSL